MSLLSNLTPDDILNFKAEMRANLQGGISTITFTKKDGTERKLKCTLQSALLPVVENIDATVKERKIPTESLAVYDLENNAWKSFRWDSISTVETL